MRIRDLIVVLSLGAGACGPSGSYVWVKDLPPTADFSRAKVRNDGRIALPLLGDVEVRGKKPSALRAELEARLKEYIVAPSVTVNVEEIAPVTVSVLGE